MNWSEKRSAIYTAKKIAALGLAFKPDVDDLRESPAVEVVHLLQGEGATVKAFEPFKLDADLPGVTAVPTLAAALKDADAVILLVNHTELRLLTPEISGMDDPCPDSHRYRQWLGWQRLGRGGVQDIPLGSAKVTLDSEIENQPENVPTCQLGAT